MIITHEIINRIATQQVTKDDVVTLKKVLLVTISLDAKLFLPY